MEVNIDNQSKSLKDILIYFVPFWSIYFNVSIIFICSSDFHSPVQKLFWDENEYDNTNEVANFNYCSYLAPTLNGEIEKEK
jgi:hypothetical protein